MSRAFWLELAVIGEGVLIVVLFVRVSRVESLLSRVLTRWGGRKGG
jgi:hypothetical protein